eukprot:3303919-Ditylum_brightwellii.AAC.1
MAAILAYWHQHLHELEDGDNWASKVSTTTMIFCNIVHTQQRQNKASSTGLQPILDTVTCSI